MRRLFAYLCFALLCWAAVPGLAQTRVGTDGPISLVADNVSFDPAAGVLVAQGNVNIFRGTQILRTERVIFDQRKGQLRIPGPLVLADGTKVVTKANGAVIDSDLENGLIEGANLLIEEQLQVAATRFHRKDGKYKVLDNAVATACHVCSKNPIPYWQIRSRRIVHDEAARRLYFESATLAVLGVPIFYTPRLSVPDPSVQRATGFLVPRITNSNLLGYGISVPYYVVLGDHSDFTITPRVFTKGSAIIGLQYRRETKRGRYQIEGHVTASDDLEPHETRSSLSASGTFLLPREVVLSFGIEVASDKSVRDDYDIKNDGNDRLTSFISLSRTRANTIAIITARATQSLRTNEVDTDIPVVLPELFARKTWADPYLGGKFGLTAQSVTLLRDNKNRFSRIGLTADWSGEWITRGGLVFDAYAGVTANSYYTRNYTGFADGTTTEITPTMSVGLRYPLARQVGRVTHLIEPRIQIVWTPGGTRTNPNEDSTQLEFEETNLFSRNRFPGFDRTEQGLRANIGLTYKRIDPEGWSLGVTVGRVFRERDLGQFGAGTGLTGNRSDYVTALTFNWRDRIDFINRTLFDDDFSVSKNEARLALTYDRFVAEASYIWLEQNVVASASDRTHEAALGFKYRYSDSWSYSGKWRQNLETGQSTSGEFGLRYENECIAFNLSYSLQFEGSGSVRPSREFGLTVELAGLGTKKRKKRYARRCAAL
ncbi:MAG: LPS assembly protein LptD [Pseudomonadota bacterium]